MNTDRKGADAGLGSRRVLVRLLPLAAMVAGGLILWLWLGERLSLATLARHHGELQALRAAHPLATAALFVIAYAGAVALSLPASLLATLAGGLFFGLVPGVFLNLAGATLGAVAVYLAARFGPGGWVQARLARGAGPAARIVGAMRRHEIACLLAMRLVPVVPFFLANLLPALVGTGLVRFALTTLVGILPACVVYTALGAGLGDVIAAGTMPTAADLARPSILWPLAALGLLSLVPLMLRLRRRAPPAGAHAAEAGRGGRPHA